MVWLTAEARAGGGFAETSSVCDAIAESQEPG
jgi:hypothetical protein